MQGTKATQSSCDCNSLGTSYPLRFPTSTTSRYSPTGQINAAACLSSSDIAELAANFTQRQKEVALKPRPRETASPMAGGGTGAGPSAKSAETVGDRAGRSILVKPPQLPVDDPTALGARDEEDISLLEEFFVKVRVVRYVFPVWCRDEGVGCAMCQI